MKLLLRRLLATVLLLPLLLLLMLAGLLGTAPGSRWLLAQVPGLQVEDFSGNLLGSWRSGQLQWQDGATRIQLDALQVQLRPSCLSGLHLCLARVHADRLAIELPPAAGADTPAQPLQLGDLQLPLAVSLDDLRLGAVQLDGQPLLGALHLRARLEQQRLQLQDLQLDARPLADWRLQASQLSLGLQGDWPLQGQLQLDGPAPDGVQAGPARWPLTATLGGSLGQRLQLQLDSSGWLEGQLQGWIGVLDPQLPAAMTGQLRLTAPLASLPANLQPGALELDLRGQRDSGWQLQAHTRLGSTAELALALDSLLHPDRLQLQGLSLRDAAGGELRASGQLDWRAALQAQLQLESGTFAWQRLHPAIPAGLGLRGLQLQARLDAEQYQGQLALQLATPAGDGQLQAPFAGDFSSLRLPALHWQQGSSQLQGALALQFASLQWQAELQASAFDPAAWLAELPGRIGGQLQAQGDAGSARAHWQLDGQLRQQALQARGQLDWAGSHLQLDGLQLALGANRVQGALALDQQLTGQLDLQLPRLDQLWPGLRGRLQGHLQLAGTPQLPQGQLTLQGQASLAGQRIGQLQLDARLDARQQGRLQLQARDLQLNGERWQQLQLQASGDRQQQQARLQADGSGERQLALRLAGTLAADGQWRGSLSDGRIVLAGMDWRQQAAASLQRSASGRIELGAHCWLMQQARLCAGTQQLAPQPQLDLRLQALPLHLLADGQSGARLDGSLSAALRLTLEDAGPRGELWLDAGQGSLRLPASADRQPLEFSWQQARLDSQLLPQRIDSQLQLQGPQLGQLQLQARLDPRSQQLTGSYQLDALQLALLQPLLPEDLLIAGTLAGTGQLGGSLQAPQVEGSLDLHGRIGGEALPLAFEDLALRLDIQGNRATLDGRWRGGEQGRGQIDGQLQWLPQPLVDVRIRGSRLPVQVEPWAELEVEPDLQLSLQDGALRLGGELAVPRGSIEIRQLPESAVGLSPDARILGEEQTSPSLPLQADVRLRIGADRLTFSGFGLQAALRGNLRVREDLQARGTLQLVDGRYKAWGQDLTLRRARLLFAGALERPQLDIEAVRSFKDENLVAGIRLSGPADEPQSAVFSEPSRSQEEALSWLVLGRAPGSSSEDQNMLARAGLALGLAGGAPVARGLADRLGIQDFQLESSGSGLTTSVVASGYLTSRLSLRYGVGVFEPASTLALRYDLSKRLYLEAASGLASSLDIFYRKDY